MKVLALILTLMVLGGCAEQRVGRPFEVRSVKYLQGGFGAAPKTIITTKKGGTVVIRGHHSIPDSKKVTVIGVRRWGGSVRYSLIEENR